MSEWQRIFYGGQEIRGRIGAHECHHCGHPGLVVEVDGRFYLPLQPGMKIVIEADQKFGETIRYEPATYESIPPNPPTSPESGGSKPRAIRLENMPQLIRMTSSEIARLPRKPHQKYPVQNPEQEDQQDKE